MEVISLISPRLWAGRAAGQLGGCTVPTPGLGRCPAPLRPFSTSRLKDLFYRSSNLQYFKRLIQIPQLPEVRAPGPAVGAAGSWVLSDLRDGQAWQVTRFGGVSSLLRTHPTSCGPLRCQNTSALWWSSQPRPRPRTASPSWRRMTSWTWMPPSR